MVILQWGADIVYQVGITNLPTLACSKPPQQTKQDYRMHDKVSRFPNDTDSNSGVYMGVAVLESVAIHNINGHRTLSWFIKLQQDRRHKSSYYSHYYRILETFTREKVTKCYTL